MESRPIIALIGRPNVGKSTLFNRLIGRREAITSHEAGTTRDRHFGVMQWFQNSWTVVDTSGILFEEDDKDLENRPLQQAMDEQVELAVEEASLIALVVDAKSGIHRDDIRLMEQLRKQEKPIVILVNKADNADLRLEAETFRQLGVEHVFPVSALHGTGVRDLVDHLIEHMPSRDEHPTGRVPRITFVGRPNVGKSTLMNQILGENRVVVSEIPGTTRDTIDSEVTLSSGDTMVLVDTAGIRRKGKIEAGIEKFSLFRTLRAINYSDIVVLLLTIEEVPTRGDAHVAMYAMEANKKLIILLNKADLAKENIFRLKPDKQRSLGQKFLRRFPFLQRLPFYFVSAQTGAGVKEFLDALHLLIKP